MPEDPVTPDEPTKPLGETTSPVERATQAIMRFEMPERLLLLGSGLAFVLGFFAWFSFKSMFGSMSVDGYDGAGWLFGIASVAVVCLLIVPTLRQAVLGGTSPKNAKLILFGLAAAAFAFGPLRFLLSGPGEGLQNIPQGMNDGFSAGRTMWFWLAFLASGTAVGGGFLALREEVPK